MKFNLPAHSLSSPKNGSVSEQAGGPARILVVCQLRPQCRPQHQSPVWEASSLCPSNDLNNHRKSSCRIGPHYIGYAVGLLPPGVGILFSVSLSFNLPAFLDCLLAVGLALPGLEARMIKGRTVQTSLPGISAIPINSGGSSATCNEVTSWETASRQMHLTYEAINSSRPSSTGVV
jgi:hypothetical protein